MIDKKEVRLEIWDTSGQERYRTVTKSYFDRAMGVMLVYDCTDEQSFNDVKNWVKQLENHAREDIVKLLVANKSDLTDFKVDVDTGKALAEELNMKFIETSAKLGTNVEQAFNSIAEQILEKNMAVGLERNSTKILSKTRSGKEEKSNCC
jgi:Ras-related protein Rab-1A